MLDGLSISHRSGLILWSKSYTTSSTSSSAQQQQPLNSLVQEVLLNSSGTTNEGDTNKFDKDAQSLMWTLANDLGLIFVVVWPRILHLTYLEKLLDSMRTLFCNTYGDLVRSITTGNVSEVALPEDGNWSKLWKGWDSIVSKLVRELEEEAARQSRKQGGRTLSSNQVASNGIQSPASNLEAEGATSPTLSPKAGTDAEAIARNIAALKARNKGRLSPAPRGVAVKKGKGGASSASEASDNELAVKRSTPSKTARRWEDSSKVTDKDMAALDFSSQDLAADLEDGNVDALVDEAGLGKRGADGLYEVADYNDQGADDDDDNDGILASLAAAKLSTKESQDKSQSKSGFSSFFSRLSTSTGFASKTLTSEDLKPVLNGMREHLMNKNVARDIADQICDSVGQSLVGKKTSGFGDGGVKAEVRKSLEESLTRILTSKTSTDILLDISRKRKAHAATDSARKPYVITFVGVNGVGKSTNLSKVAFWLLQNKMRVLIAACDTFRSGAVEQLRVHVRNLSKLKLLQENQESSEPRVELYEKGYGKDAAGIAKDAISHAAANAFDVVLIDTAGRMQDNEPLMRALAKLVSVNSPDKIFFVGEAVVGNEAVDQLTKFNRSLKDFSGVSNTKARGIDGMILTKMDIIDDKVGAALSMTYVTGQPIMFIGTGQTYTDLRAMKVSHVVNALMRN